MKLKRPGIVAAIGYFLILYLILLIDQRTQLSLDWLIIFSIANFVVIVLWGWISGRVNIWVVSILLFIGSGFLILINQIAYIGESFLRLDTWAELVTASLINLYTISLITILLKQQGNITLPFLSVALITGWGLLFLARSDANIRIQGILPIGFFMGSIILPFLFASVIAFFVEIIVLIYNEIRPQKIHLHN